jgi:hypothetical protein
MVSIAGIPGLLLGLELASTLCGRDERRLVKQDQSFVIQRKIRM